MDSTGEEEESEFSWVQLDETNGKIIFKKSLEVVGMEMREMKEDNSSYMFRINWWGYHQNWVEPLFQSFFNVLFFLDSLF